MRLSPWIDYDHCSMRIIEGSDSEKISNRIAFIEKTPRVRIKNFGLEIPGTGSVRGSDVDAWLYGPKGDGELCGEDPDSREWCDKMLVLLGYSLS